MSSLFQSAIVYIGIQGLSCINILITIEIFSFPNISNARVLYLMLVSPSSQYGLKAQVDIDPRGIRVTNGLMR